MVTVHLPHVDGAPRRPGEKVTRVAAKSGSQLRVYPVALHPHPLRTRFTVPP